MADKRTPRMTALTKKVLDFVLSRGQATTQEVLAAIGRYIPATKASKTGHAYVETKIRERQVSEKRRHDGKYILKCGRRKLVQNSLRSLRKQGYLRWVSRGVYAAPLPKLYQPEEKAG